MSEFVFISGHVSNDTVYTTVYEYSCYIKGSKLLGPKSQPNTQQHFPCFIELIKRFIYPLIYVSLKPTSLLIRPTKCQLCFYCQGWHVSRPRHMPQQFSLNYHNYLMNSSLRSISVWVDFYSAGGQKG